MHRDIAKQSRPLAQLDGWGWVTFYFSVFHLQSIDPAVSCDCWQQQYQSGWDQGQYIYEIGRVYWSPTHPLAIVSVTHLSALKTALLLTSFRGLWPPGNLGAECGALIYKGLDCRRESNWNGAAAQCSFKHINKWIACHLYIFLWTDIRYCLNCNGTYLLLINFRKDPITSNWSKSFNSERSCWILTDGRSHGEDKSRL